MKKKFTRIISPQTIIAVAIGALFILALHFMLKPPIQGLSPESREGLQEVRQARDMIDDGDYEAAYKLLNTLGAKYSSDILYAVSHRQADLMMRKDPANPHYDISNGSYYLIGAAKRKQAAMAKCAYAEMLKRSPYMQMMPEVLVQEPLRWYSAAAELGYAPAQQQVGAILSADGGPNIDYVVAYMWLQLAHNRYADESVHQHKENRLRADAVKLTCDKLVENGHLNAKQVKKALKMAKKWEKQHPTAYKIWPVAEQDY